MTSALERKQAEAALIALESDPAEAVRLLSQMASDTSDPATRAALLNDLGLCALHEGRPADAAALLRHAVAALPAPAVEGRCVAAAKARCQLLLNLCEAESAAGHHSDTLRIANAIVQLAQSTLGVTKECGAASGALGSAVRDMGPSESARQRLSTGATSRLFLAKWLLPAPSCCHASACLDGALPLTEALLLSWVWCALSQEAMGMFSESLKSYNFAMGVADVDRSAANALVKALKKKVALTSAILSWEQDDAASADEKLAVRRGQPRCSGATVDGSLRSIGRSGGSAKNISSHVTIKAGAVNSGGTKSAFAVYALASAERAGSTLRRDQALRDERRRQAGLHAQAAARADAKASRTNLLPEVAKHSVEYARDRAARRALPEGALTENDRAALAESEAALRRRVQEGGRRAELAQAAAARKRVAASRRSLGRIVWALTALLAEKGANIAMPFSRVVGELEKLRDDEKANGSERRARSLSTALWLLRRCTPPKPPLREADESYTKAIAMLEWLLVHFDDSQVKTGAAVPDEQVVTKDTAAEGDEPGINRVSQPAILAELVQASRPESERSSPLQVTQGPLDDPARQMSPISRTSSAEKSNLLEDLVHLASPRRAEDTREEQTATNPLEALIRTDSPHERGESARRYSMPVEGSSPHRPTRTPSMGVLTERRRSMPAERSPLNKHARPMSPTKESDQSTSPWRRELRSSQLDGRRSRLNSPSLRNPGTSPRSLERNLNPRHSNVTSGSEANLIASASRWSTPTPATQVRKPTEQILAKLATITGADGYFGEVVFSQSQRQLPLPGEAVSATHYTSHDYLPDPSAEPIKVMGGKRLTAMESPHPRSFDILEEERRAAAREAEQRSLAQRKQRAEVEQRRVAYAAEQAKASMLEYSAATRGIAADVRSALELEEKLAIDQRVWAHHEAEARRREVERVLRRESELAEAQRERLGVVESTSPLATEETTSRQSEPGPSVPLLLQNRVAMHVTPEMVAFINDLHSSFALFITSSDVVDANPPMVVAGELIGGGEVPASDIELVLESFGTNYLAPRAHDALKDSLKQMRDRNITFVEFVQAMVVLMAQPNEKLLPQALASLYAAFALFDDSGSGKVRMSDIELVLQALSCHLETSELDELSSLVGAHLEAHGAPDNQLVPFHSFLEYLVPASQLVHSAGNEIPSVVSTWASSSARELTSRKAPVSTLSQRLALLPALTEAQLHQLRISFAGFPADDDTMTTSDHIAPMHLQPLLHAMGISIQAADVSGLLREIGANDAASELESLHAARAQHGNGAVLLDANPSGHSLVDFQTVQVLCQAAFFKLRHLQGDNLVSSKEDARNSASQTMPNPVTAMEDNFNGYVGADGRIDVDDVELLLKELGIHLAHTELESALQRLFVRQGEQANRLTLQQVHALFHLVASGPR
mmetsp:Transcript_7208/g.20506  ORF Transcript_7208/g.20506 Transcript_7208/m.20506 type:complete len:1419 (+) Transcript_7208:92-4348(+)